MPQHQYLGQTAQVAEFLDNVMAAQNNGGSTAILDSVKNEAGVNLPKHLAQAVDGMSDDSVTKVLDNVQRGALEYRARHGVDVTADVVEAALQQGLAATLPLKQVGNGGATLILDAVGNSNHSSNEAYQANRIIVAVVSAMSEAIPFAGYLPVDIKSNTAKLAVLTHVADSTWGDYAKGQLMDGTSVGGSYAMSVRTVMLKQAGAGNTLATSSKFTAESLANLKGYCDPTKTGVPVLRGRTLIYVNGVPVASEPASSSGTLSGRIELGGVAYSLGAQINPSTGALSSVSCTPAPTDDMEITAEAVVDYEAAPGLTPRIIVQAETWDMHATAMRIMGGSTIDASSQMAGELGLDSRSEILMHARVHTESERHYAALRYVKALGRNQSTELNFDFAAQKGAKDLSMMWRDVAPHFWSADQAMAESTMDHGVTHYYVGPALASMLQSAPGDVFQSSGISGRTSIYRLGRLFGKYEVYYSPKMIDQAADGSWGDMIGVGRSSQTARCPIILGDAFAPTFLEIARTGDLSTNDALYARNFTAVNPHAPSARGCNRIRVTGLK